jgi:hypothetical protein
VWLLYFTFGVFLLDVFSVQIRNKILQKRIVLSYDYNRLASSNRLWVDRLVHIIKEKSIKLTSSSDMKLWHISGMKNVTPPKINTGEIQSLSTKMQQ